jgi:hypothetical protein
MRKAKLGARPVALTEVGERRLPDQSYLHRDVVAYTGLTTAAVVNEPFLAVGDTAF